jgi:hypothetical protein
MAEPNPFDQFDNLRFGAMPGLRSAPPVTVDNFADRFNAATGSEGENPFDQFDRLRFGAPTRGSSMRSIATQVPVGFNETLADVVGAPVDLMTGALNLGGRGVNAAYNAMRPRTLSDLVTDSQEKELIPPIRRPFGGSESIKQGMGLVGLNPEDIPANTAGERIARGAGGGVAAVVAPEAILGTLAKLGPAAREAYEAVVKLFGRTSTAGDLATTAAAGGAGGAAGEAAAEVTPEPYKPLARTVGAVAGGLPVAAAPLAAGEAARLGRNFVAPMREAGREEMAGGRLANAASDISGAREALDSAPREIVPGSKPTTFQLTGDTGLGALEREVQTRNPADFAERRGEQNAARVEALQNVQRTGAPEEVSGFLRSRLADIDKSAQRTIDAATSRLQERTAALPGQGTPEQYGATLQAPLRARQAAIEQGGQREVDQATARAQGAAGGLGGQGTPEEYGAALRTAAQEAETAARAGERSLWNAVDPDNTLTVGMGPVQRAERSVYGGLSEAAAAGLTPAETTIRRVIGTYRGVEPFRELSDLRSAISGAMRAEMRTAGRSPAYARLTQLRGAVEDSLADVVEQRVMQEAQSAGRVPTEQTMAARLQAAAPQTGSDVFTPSGRRIGVDYQIANAGDLVTSHNADLSPNPAFPSELQPRDRTRAASETQIARMAGNLQPERLGASASAAEGAPIIGPDRVVESGNARVLAIRQALRENGPSAAAYRDFLRSQGFDTRGIAEPVLVRQRQTMLSPADRVRFTQEANAAPGLSMSASERAAADAGRLPDGVLDLYRGGELGAAQNRDFVRAFLRSVPERGEEGAFATQTGALSLDGERRIQNALLHAAYGDSGLVARLAEAGDENIRGLGSALTDVAGEMAQLRRGVASGAVSPTVDIAPSILRAVDLVGEARARGVPLASAVAQRDAFAGIDPLAELVLKLAYGRDYSSRLSRGYLADRLRDYVSEAGQQTTEARLFGEALESSAILQSVGARYGRASEPQGSGAGAHAARESRGTRRPPGSGPEPSTPRARSPGQSQGADVLERSELTANFDQAARERLSSASAATRERARTFNQGVVGQILRTQGDRGNFRMGAGAVPGNIFRPGPGGFEAVQAFRHAAGNGGDAQLRDAVAASARRYAQNENGTIDPARLARWQAAHADALRAVPHDVAGEFTNAARATEAIAAAEQGRQAAVGAFREGGVGRMADAGEAAVPGNIFRPGPGGHDTVQAFRRAVGDDDEAMGALQDAVAVSARKYAQRPDGTIDPDKFARWRTMHADALRAVPGDVAERFADASRATAAIDAAALARKAALDEYQQGAIGKLIGVSEPADVVKTVGGIFARNDAAGQMRRLAGETAKNPDARDGLRKAVVDYMYGRFVGNTEVGTSGIGGIKKDTFQGFLRQNRASLGNVFSPAELNGLTAIAADLERANRSLTAIRIPGQSNTAQDTIAALEKKPEGHGSLLMQAVLAGGAGYEAGGIKGAALGLTGAFGKYFVHKLRGAGMEKVEDLVKQRRQQTKKRQPPVKLPPRLLAHMRRWAGLGIAKRAVIEWNGKPIESVRKGFAAAVRAAGLGNDVTPHVLRHTCATWLMQNGVNLWDAAGFLGMTVQQLEQGYGHHHPEFQQEAVAALGGQHAARNNVNKPRQTHANVTKIGDISNGK